MVLNRCSTVWKYQEALTSSLSKKEDKRLVKIVRNYWKHCKIYCNTNSSASMKKASKKDRNKHWCSSWCLYVRTQSLTNKAARLCHRNDIIVYFHKHHSIKLPHQVSSQNKYRGLQHQVWIDVFRAIHLWSYHPYSNLMPSVSGALTSECALFTR